MWMQAGSSAASQRLPVLGLGSLWPQAAASSTLLPATPAMPVRSCAGMPDSPLPPHTRAALNMRLLHTVNLRCVVAMMVAGSCVCHLSWYLLLLRIAREGDIGLEQQAQGLLS